MEVRRVESADEEDHPFEFEFELDEVDVEVEAFSAPWTETTLCISALTFRKLIPRSNVPGSGTGISTQTPMVSLFLTLVFANPTLTGMEEIGRGISTKAGRTSPSSTSSMEGPEGQRWISIVSTWVVLPC